MHLRRKKKHITEKFTNSKLMWQSRSLIVLEVLGLMCKHRLFGLKRVMSVSGLTQHMSYTDGKNSCRNRNYSRTDINKLFPNPNLFIFHVSKEHYKLILIAVTIKILESVQHYYDCIVDCHEVKYNFETELKLSHKP